MMRCLHQYESAADLFLRSSTYQFRNLIVEIYDSSDPLVGWAVAVKYGREEEGGVLAATHFIGFNIEIL